MEKSCHSSATSGGDSITSSSTNNNNNNNNNRQNPSDHFLKHLNKISHKISKQPIVKKTPPLPPLDQHNNHHQNQNQNQSFQNQSQNQNQNLHQQQQQQQSQTQIQNQELQNQHNQQLQQQQQPPVYNINKSDFRDVVQKLTGSPAHHDRFSTPPPIQPPKPPSSRLHRIRPPPLQPPRPTSPLNNPAAFIPQPQPPLPNTNPNLNNNNNSNNPGSSSFGGRQVTPLSPLPPFPSVHGAAESPISAYMRYLQSTTPTLDAESRKFTGFSSVPPILSPKWNNQPNSFFQQQQQQFLLPSPNSMANSQFPMPNSPLGFGLLSPSLLFSPTSGQLGFPQFPPSPRLPLLSPRWRGV
ncbi:hypothetical protein MKW98_001335 [Papaver atlanticum]|uniref:VQ domain-containing protein n=1 Tax=Papaver atlanticum TaxID=357466 RepID=A0AAD4STK7_9MAGN|nr:hypothetical protein MKW98_001335 [Papaver atlanticum]